MQGSLSRDSQLADFFLQRLAFQAHGGGAGDTSSGLSRFFSEAMKDVLLEGIHVLVSVASGHHFFASDGAAWNPVLLIAWRSCFSVTCVSS